MGILVPHDASGHKFPDTFLNVAAQYLAREGGNKSLNSSSQLSSRAAPRSACFPAAVLFRSLNELTLHTWTRLYAILLPMEYMILELSLDWNPSLQWVSPLMSDLISAPLMALKWDHFSVGGWWFQSRCVAFPYQCPVVSYFFSSLPCPRLTDKSDKVKVCISASPKATPWDLRLKVHADALSLVFHGVVHHTPCLPKPHCPSSLHADWFSFEKPFLSCFIEIPLLQRFLYFHHILGVSSCCQPWLTSRSYSDLKLLLFKAMRLCLG